MCRWRSLDFLLLLIASPISSAFCGNVSEEKSQSPARSIEEQNRVAALERRISIFGGVAGGATYLLSQTNTEVNKYGFHLILNAGVSVRNNFWDFDASSAYFYNRLYSSKGEEEKIETLGAPLEQRDVNIRSRTGIVTAAARRKINDVWRLGPALALVLDRSVAFTQHPEAKATRFLGGISATRDLNFHPIPRARATCDLETDLNISNRQVFLLSVGLQIGIDVFRNSEWQTAKTPEPSVPPGPPPVRVVFDSQAVNFDSAKWTLEPRLEKFVKGLGDFLKANNDSWKTLIIEGHTDSRGKLEYNKDLSQKRAQAIQNLLVSEGVASSRISAQGFGPLHPAISPEVTPEDLRKNRRVVLVFEGVLNPEALGAEIAKLRKELGLLTP